MNKLKDKKEKQVKRKIILFFVLHLIKEIVDVTIRR